MFVFEFVLLAVTSGKKKQNKKIENNNKKSKKTKKQKHKTKLNQPKVVIKKKWAYAVAWWEII